MSQSDSSSIAPAYILHAATVYTLFCPQFFSHLLSIDYRLFNVSLFIPLSLCRTADSNSHLSRPTQNPNSSVKDKRRSIAKRPSVAFYYAVIYFLLFCLCVCVCVCLSSNFFKSPTCFFPPDEDEDEDTGPSFPTVTTSAVTS